MSDTPKAPDPLPIGATVRTKPNVTPARRGGRVEGHFGDGSMVSVLWPDGHAALYGSGALEEDKGEP